MKLLTFDGEFCPVHPQWFARKMREKGHQVVCPYCAQEQRGRSYAEQRRGVPLLRRCGAKRLEGTMND